MIYFYGYLMYCRLNRVFYHLYLESMPIANKIRFDNLRGDIFGGVTASVASQSLTLAFGVASGVS
ncbi:MAG: hypothetical protein ACRC6M_06550 [Microcystaceae cyanobacterium]